MALEEHPQQPAPQYQARQANQKRAHRKSRKGCFNCKRRKVKCDEDQPACANCIRFKIPCHYPHAVVPDSGSRGLPTANTVITPSGSSETSDNASPSTSTRRGRGRPRKDWSVIPPQKTATTSLPLAHGITASAERSRTLNVADAELLLYFVSSTALTFVAGGDKKPADPIVKFWVHNVPRIGLTHHFVLHLTYAIAGYHLAYKNHDDSQRHTYISLAGHHFSEGLIGMTKVLPDLNSGNCGALYVAATLVCYCAFAAGPNGPGDLLLCDTINSGPTRCVALIHGLKHIRESADIRILATGPTAPLFTSEQDHEKGPRYTREGFPRADWVAPFDQLRALISQGDRAVYLGCFEALENIYAATYGDNNGEYDGPPEHQFVLGWLYRVEDSYVTGLREGDPLALILLAHFALLLSTMGDWFLDGWAEHLITQAAEHVPANLEHWLRWPEEQARLQLGGKRAEGIL